MHVAVTGMLVIAIIVIGVRETRISGDKACSHPQRAHRLDHEHGKVATAPAAKLQCKMRVLDTFFMPCHMGEVFFYGSVQLYKKRMGIGWFIDAQHRADPLIQLAMPFQGLPLEERGEGRHVLRPIDERVGSGKTLDFHVDDVGWEVIEPNGTIKAKHLSSARKARSGDVVAEDILRPAEIGRLRTDLEP
jgi:hypothetical protein